MTTGPTDVKVTTAAGGPDGMPLALKLNEGLGHSPTMPPVWRLEGRANPFVPWVVVEHCARLEDACARATVVKRQYRFYAVHVRAN